MRHIRTALVAAALAMSVAATGAAAQGGGPMRGGMMQRLLNGITLTAAQQTQVQAIEAKYAPQFQQYRQKMRDARQSGQPMDSATFAAMHDLSLKERAEIRAVLTPDQQATFDENVKNMPQRGRPPR